jgi:hypothetical protein
MIDKRSKPICAGWPVRLGSHTYVTFPPPFISIYSKVIRVSASAIYPGCMLCANSLSPVPLCGVVPTKCSPEVELHRQSIDRMWDERAWAWECGMWDVGCGVRVKSPLHPTNLPPIPFRLKENSISTTGRHDERITSAIFFGHIELYIWPDVRRTRCCTARQ